MQDVVSDPTDPATKRPNIPPAKKVGQSFQGLKLPDFPLYINLPTTVQPSNAQDIFRLFIDTKIVAIIVNHTNWRAEQLSKEGLKPRALLKSWYPVTVEEIYAYIGIRIYIGIYKSPCVRDYQACRTNNQPTHPLKEVMSRERYEAIHARMRIATADSKTEFEAVFERVSNRLQYLA